MCEEYDSAAPSRCARSMPLCRNPPLYGSIVTCYRNAGRGSVSQRSDPPSQDRRSLGYLVSTTPLATDHESRLHRLAETLPCNRKPQKANQWMSEWAPLPEHVDLPCYEEIQQECNQRDCPDGMMSRLWRWIKGSSDFHQQSWIIQLMKIYQVTIKFSIRHRHGSTNQPHSSWTFGPITKSDTWLSQS